MQGFEVDEVGVEAMTGDVMPSLKAIAGSGERTDAVITWLFLALAVVSAVIGLAGTIGF